MPFHAPAPATPTRRAVQVVAGGGSTYERGKCTLHVVASILENFIGLGYALQSLHKFLSIRTWDGGAGGTRWQSGWVAS